jgi:aldehyde:ferredoxin oxidoreductase
LNGYVGKLLVVDLTSGRIANEPLNRDYAREFIGGSGLAARYLFDRLRADTDPLGPDNTLVVMAGPLTGTKAPSCGRFVVAARSPLTGIWGEANCGAVFGPEMRFAGYDGLIVTGQAARPVYLWVHDGQAELRDATSLWGQDTYATQRLIAQEVGDAKAKSLCIGQGGENLVRYAAALTTHGRAAGRSGLGAVMGSKNLKAIAVRGHGTIPLCAEAEYNALARETQLYIKDDMLATMYRAAGTAGIMDYMNVLGDVPARYFTLGQFDGVDKLSGTTMAETMLTGTSTCFACPTRCGREVSSEGRYALPENKGPEYETVVSLGNQLLIDDLAAVSYLGYLCDAYGLDTISCGNTIAFAYYLFDQGVIGPPDTGGLELHWGDSDVAATLIAQIARRQGFGAVLAEGSQRVGERYGVPELAVQVHGLEPGMHDPRALSGMALVYATSPRGACHNKSDFMTIENGGFIEALGIASPGRFESEGKGPMVARHQCWRSVGDSLVMCEFANASVEQVIGLLRAATGYDVSVDNVLTYGERILTLKRLLNLRLGYAAANEKLPKLLAQPLVEGGTEGHVPDLTTMRREYYAYLDWDSVTGQPSPARLAALGLA